MPVTKNQFHSCNLTLCLPDFPLYGIGPDLSIQWNKGDKNLSSSSSLIVFIKPVGHNDMGVFFQVQGKKKNTL